MTSTEHFRLLGGLLRRAESCSRVAVWAGGALTIASVLLISFDVLARKFLGFTVSRNGMKLKVADKAIDKLKDRVRELTRRTRGNTLGKIVAELRKTLLGWKAYFGIAEVLSPLHDIDKWIRRKLRCYLWKQWGRAGYRELRKRGVSVREAWNTSKSAHGPWRLSNTPALRLALPVRYFKNLGLPAIAVR